MAQDTNYDLRTEDVRTLYDSQLLKWTRAF